MKRWIATLFATLVLTGCSLCTFEPTLKSESACKLHPPPKPRLPYPAWYLAVTQPLYMETWVETAEVEDVRGLRFLDAYRGLAPSSAPTAGWGRGGGMGRQVQGADLPRRVFLRWQSLVEPQTYRITLEIPESARQLMLKQEPSVVVPAQRGYRNILQIGIAPGGKVVLWNEGSGQPKVEILRAQAEVEPLGPSQGQTNGQYAYTFEQLEPATQRYIKEHGIPYGSW